MIDEITGDIKVGAPLDRELIQVRSTISTISVKTLIA